MNKFYFNAITVYRISNYLYGRGMYRLSKIVDVVTYILFNSTVPGSCSIGEGTYCSHRGMSVVLHPEVKVGKNCVIGTCVTLGGKGKGVIGAPVVGDGVYLSTGSKVLGPVVIGDRVVIGANAVVVCDIPDDTTAVGIPARILNSNGYE